MQKRRRGHGYRVCRGVAGDLAHVVANGQPLPLVAPVAVQQGRCAAQNILAQISGQPLELFRYRDRGAMVTIGRNAAVARIGGRSYRGVFAWVVWLVIHIMNLIVFRNRLFVMTNWAWDYFFFERTVRLIMPSSCESPSAGNCLKRPFMDRDEDAGEGEG